MGGGPRRLSLTLKVKFAVYEIRHGESFPKQNLDARSTEKLELRNVLAYATHSLERLQVPPIDGRCGLSVDPPNSSLGAAICD